MLGDIDMAFCSHSDSDTPACFRADLKRALYCMFSQFGSILDVVATKTLTGRGQVHSGDVRMQYREGCFACACSCKSWVAMRTSALFAVSPLTRVDCVHK